MNGSVIRGLSVVSLAGGCGAQERPYFVTYSHEMEEPENLEIEFFNAAGNHGPGTASLEVRRSALVAGKRGICGKVCLRGRSCPIGSLGK